MADLEHSNDYRTISFKGQQFHLTPRQAAIVRVLHQSPYYEASSQIIKKHAKCGGPVGNCFKSGDGPEVWQQVIVHHPRGFYRLNLTSKN